MRTTTTTTSLFVALTLGCTFALAHCGTEEEPTSKDPVARGPSGGGTSAEAKKYFSDNVFPQLAANCADGCHNGGKKGAPPFLTDTPGGSYNAIEAVEGYIAAPSASPIAQKGLHSGPALTEKQVELVTKWLTLEVNARKLSVDNTKPPNLREGFRRFGECMSYKRWMELKLNEICMVPTQGNTGPCAACHNGGQSSLWLSADAAETFSKFTQYPYVQKLVVGRVSPSGSFDGLEPSRRLMDKGTEARQPQANTHPLYTLSTEQTLAINTFVNETLVNMTSGTCVADKPDAGPDAK